MILITRPIDEALSTKKSLKAIGYEAIIYPFSNICSMNFIQTNKIYNAIIITSKNAVLNIDAVKYRHIPTFTVGKACGQYLKSKGFKKIDCSSENVNQLINLINNVLPCNKSLLYIRGKEITKELRSAFFNYSMDELVTYRAQLKEFLNPRLYRLFDKIEYIMFYSTRTAEAFTLHVKIDLRSITAICISQSVADVLYNLNFKNISVAVKPNEIAMFNLL